MQTPEEFAWDLRYPSQHRTWLDIADLIRARDAEVRAETLAEVKQVVELHGFDEPEP